MDFWDNFLIYARHADLKELRATQRSLRRRSYQRRKQQSQVDRKQSERIEALEHENDDLKLSLCALLAVLQRRGHLEEAEVMEIVQPILEPFSDTE
jgi:hypothetical protein